MSDRDFTTEPAWEAWGALALALVALAVLAAADTAARLRAAAGRAPTLVLLAAPLALVALACLVAGFCALPARALLCLGLIGGALGTHLAFPVRLDGPHR